MSLYAFLHNKTPPACLPLHRLVVPNGREKRLQRDDVLLGAGDGTRTRDSLLGRQELYRLSYSRKMGEQEEGLLTAGSGCADLNRGPPAPKAGALPTAPHPVYGASPANVGVRAL